MSGSKIAQIHLPAVNPKFYPGIFGKFEDTVVNRIKFLRGSRVLHSSTKANFFEWLLTEIEPSGYHDMQREQLLNPDPRIGYYKYLDPIIWFEHKIDIAIKLGLNQGQKRKILDLGTGPGHFLVVARHFGHYAVGTDVMSTPQPATIGLKSDFENACNLLFDAFEDVFKTTRLPHRIEPFVPLSGLPGDVDLATAFSVYFDRFDGWTVEAWSYFLRNLRNDVLVPQGVIYMTLIKQRLKPEHWAYLSTHSRETGDATVWIDDLLRLG